jgi:hypothetical protein
VVAGSITRSLVFLLWYSKKAGSSRREPIFFAKIWMPGKKPENANYNKERNKK